MSGVTIFHERTATGADDPAADVKLGHWNASHIASVSLVAAAAIIGAFSNANGISFGDSGGKVTASYTVPSQSVQTQAAGDIARSGFTTTTVDGAVVAGTLNSQGLQLAVPAYLTTQSVQTQASGALARSGFTTTTTGGAVIAGTLNSGGLNLAVPAYITTAAQSDHSHGNPQLNLTNLSGTTASNSGGFTLSLSAAAPGGGGAGFTRSRFNPFMEAVGAEGQVGQGTLHLHPMPDPPAFQFNRAYFDVRVTQATATNSSGTATVSLWMGLYTRNGSTLSLAHSSSTTQSIVKSGTVQSNTYVGPRVMTMGWTTTVGQDDYWVGILSRSTSGGANVNTISQYLVSDVNSNFSGVLGELSNATHQNVLGLGIYSATTSGMPASIAFSQIQGTASQFLRVPLYYFVSNTA